MKHRNDGGYSLALVLVVMAVLATIVTVLLTVTIDNMRVQEKQIERMQDQYEAQGKLEKVLANLSQNQVVELQSANAQSTAVEQAIRQFCGSDVVLTVEGMPFVVLDANGEPKLDQTLRDWEAPFSFDFRLTATRGEVTVHYDLQLKGNITCSYSPQVTGYNQTDDTRMYFITSPEIVHKSVGVSGVGGGD